MKRLRLPHSAAFLKLLVLIALLLGASLPGRADMALLVEDPAGYKGFWSDSGHLAIWIADACVGARGLVEPCNGGSGAILSSTSYWTDTGWAAIPAETYLNGVPGRKEDAVWSESLRATYPELPISYGRKYIGRLNHRGSYVLRIRTTAEQDAAVLERIQEGRSRFRYETFSSNCSDFARQVLELYFPGHFRRRVIPDFGISTPHGVANRFWKLGHRNPDLQMAVYYIPRRNRGSYLHDGRTKGICEAAITDTKYALPLIFYHPLLYGAFGMCYLATDQPRFMRRGFAHDAQRVGSFRALDSAYLSGVTTATRRTGDPPASLDLYQGLLDGSGKFEGLPVPRGFSLAPSSAP